MLRSVRVRSRRPGATCESVTLIKINSRQICSNTADHRMSIAPDLLLPKRGGCYGNESIAVVLESVVLLVRHCRYRY